MKTAKDSFFSPSEIRHGLALSRERMSILLRVSAKTISRWENEKYRPGNSDSQLRLAKLREIVNIGGKVYTPEGLKAFLFTPMPVFGWKTAFDLISVGDYESVIGALAADLDGAGF